MDNQTFADMSVPDSHIENSTNQFIGHLRIQRQPAIARILEFKYASSQDFHRIKSATIFQKVLKQKIAVEALWLTVEVRLGEKPLRSTDW